MEFEYTLQNAFTMEANIMNPDQTALESSLICMHRDCMNLDQTALFREQSDLGA